MPSRRRREPDPPELIPGCRLEPEEYATWEPGVDLYPRHSHSSYLFNFRDDTDAPECRCGDAASWPEPYPHSLIPCNEGEDELDRFIASYRRHQLERRDTA